MAQTICIPASASIASYPNSPDPVHLRMLAFSVAESALQPDPNSPSFGFNVSHVPSQEDMEVATARLTALNMNAGANKEVNSKTSSRWSSQAPVVQSRQPWRTTEVTSAIAERRGRALWDVVERAKERCERDKSSPGSVDSPLPESPISPTRFSFALPGPKTASQTILNSPSYKAKMKVPGLSITSPSFDDSVATAGRAPFPLFTRSAEPSPSPTKSVFSNLDRNRPPPDFVPRLSAQDFSQKSEEIAAAVIKNKFHGHGRTKSQSLNGSPSEESRLVSPSERLRAQSRINMPSKLAHRNKLPSLAELQAKLNRVQTAQAGRVAHPVNTLNPKATGLGHRRGTSFDLVDMPTPRAQSFRPIAENDFSPASSCDVEVIQTPTDDIKRNPHIILGGLGNERPATPPTPTPMSHKDGKETKEPRLAPFLRQRTSGRLIASSRMSESPEKVTSTISVNATSTAAPLPQPVFRIIPPTLETSSRPSLALLNRARPRNAPSSAADSDADVSPTSRSFPRIPVPTRTTTLPSPAAIRATKFQGFPFASHLASSSSALIRNGMPSIPSRSATASPTSGLTGPFRSSSATGFRPSSRSSTNAGSSTLPMPIITCTPAADDTHSEDGSDSDSGSGYGEDVVVFDSEVEEAKEREERERRGREMRDLLGLRRRLSE